MLAKKTILSQELNKQYAEYLTVGQLLDFIKTNNISLDSKVCVQRVEDEYFENNNWGTVKKESLFYYIEKQFIDDVKTGKYNNKEEYPDITEEYIKNILESENDLDVYKNEYHPAYSVVKYDNDNNIYLNLFF